MPLLFMDTGYEESNSPDSLSAEESCSYASGLERDGDVQQSGPRGSKRQEKNRVAARKSRRKQTERADELHEELQRLEQSNSALQKEIAALKKDLHFYETSLESHKPYCRLKDSGSSSIDSKPSPGLHQAMKSSSSSLSTSMKSTMRFQTLSCMKQTHPKSAATTKPTRAISSSPSSSSSSSVPYSDSFSTQPAPHSLFCEPPQIPFTNATPICSSLVSNPHPSSATRLPSDAIHKNPPASETSCFTRETFSMKLDSSFPASSKMQPLLSHPGTENTTVAKQFGSINVPQIYSCQFGTNLTSLPSRPPPQYPGPRTLPVSTQASLIPSSGSPYQHHASSSPGSLLSLLTVPSPLTVSQTTSSGFNRITAQPTQSLPPLPDPSKDYSLSELLEINDWILSGVNYP
ncbi:cell wall protein RBR3 [Austrofundulus limnaeus]|uniref:Cell wall protein RBR3 n=1 Tax=Austrofundulus limnaeus TaxID=52670 RepID=A0A2I4C3D3_AUSLI|nr:PREDICTED: cell wall protein RBR3-like [Austrofundulus limnaeus]